MIAVTEVMPSPVALSAREAGISLPQFTGATTADAVDTPTPTSAAAQTTASNAPFAPIERTLIPPL